MNLANRSVSYLKARRAYCLATLNDPATAEHRKPRIIAALDQLDACLRDRCQHCGRPLSLPESVARAAGAVCAGTHGGKIAMTITDYERLYHQVLNAYDLEQHLAYYAGSHRIGHRALEGLDLDQLRALHVAAHEAEGTPLHGHPMEDA